VNYQFHVADGDPDYSLLWDRMESEPGETVFSNMEKGLQKLETSRSVMHVFAGMLKGYFR